MYVPTFIFNGKLKAISKEGVDWASVGVTHTNIRVEDNREYIFRTIFIFGQGITFITKYTFLVRSFMWTPLACV